MIVNRMPAGMERIDISGATTNSVSVTWAKTTYYLSSQLVVTYNGNTLIYGTDYTLSGTTSAYNAGTYSATITGIGNYKGTKDVTWKINTATISASWSVSANTIPVSPNKQRVKFTATVPDWGACYIVDLWGSPDLEYTEKRRITTNTTPFSEFDLSRNSTYTSTLSTFTLRVRSSGNNNFVSGNRTFVFNVTT